MYKYNYNLEKNKKNNNFAYILILVVFVIFVLIISLFLFRNNTAISKINSFLLKPFEKISSACLSSNLSSKKVLIKENAKLKEENNDLSLRLIEYQKLLNENESLRKILEIEETFQHYNLKHAQIILRSHDNYNETFVINVGEEDGIKKGQAVIHKNGLVGYISSVSDLYSTVVTILDPKTSVSVKIPTVSSPAILSGNIDIKSNNNLKLESIQIGSEISIGDSIYTSGLGNMYPSAIPVAKITKVVSKKTDSERYAICSPLVDISSINEVAVIVGDKENE